jgi:ribosomal-protein-alanine N-acetyltransferase
MTIADIPTIARIEALSVPRPWPVAAHRRELDKNPNARHFVACRAPEAEGDVSHDPSTVVGFAAMWIQADEAHVTMIAVHPDNRRLGIGQRLLVALVDEAVACRARMMTLEVRASNRSAARLYDKFGFVVEGRRKGYYADSGEDAIIMTTPEFSDAAWRDRIQGLASAG